jgi:hypothetical protein
MKFKLTKKNNKFYLLCLVVSLLLFCLGLFYYSKNKYHKENFLLYLHKDPSFINENSIRLGINSKDNFDKENREPICFPNVEMRAKTLFSSIDKDNDGIISKQEIRNSLKENPSDKTIKIKTIMSEFLGSADDNMSKNIDQEELINLMKQNSENICLNRINIDKFMINYSENLDKDALRFKSGFEDYCKDGNNPEMQGRLFNECPNQCYKLADTINELDSEVFNNMKKSHKNLTNYIEKCL